MENSVSERIIMQDSPEAAEYRTNLSGWVSSKGHYFGRDEREREQQGTTARPTINVTAVG